MPDEKRGMQVVIVLISGDESTGVLDMIFGLIEIVSFVDGFELVKLSLV